MRRKRLLLAAAVVVAPPLQAQGSGDGFLFKQPTVSLGVRGGFDHAAAGSDIFSFVTDQLTLKRGDFSSATVGTDFGIRLSARFDLVLGVAYSGSRTRSEFRRWVDQNNFPITQATYFRRVPVTASLKAYLMPRGRSIGQFAWLPVRYAPYVGVGAGQMWYRFRQAGDFVDFQTLNVFADAFNASGWTWTAHAFAGVEVSLSPRFVMRGEGRYTWARGPLGTDFVGFHNIDLSGFAMTAGVAARL